MPSEMVHVDVLAGGLIRPGGVGVGVGVGGGAERYLRYGG